MTLPEKVEILPLGVTPAAAVPAILPTTTTLAIRTIAPHPTTATFPQGSIEDVIKEGAVHLCLRLHARRNCQPSTYCLGVKLGKNWGD